MNHGGRLNGFRDLICRGSCDHHVLKSEWPRRDDDTSPGTSGTPGCKACTVSRLNTKKQCIERFHMIERAREDTEAAAAAVARAGAEISMTQRQQASSSQ